ncbi:MAG: SGNH/GDSL hydrolase family protein [Peptococcaceae bacterium]|nr:SGNH/GDSL hydrolase family protein [Peptococcaceae bacterium]
MADANIYLALGDSLTAGYGVGRNNSFATLYYHFLTRQQPNLLYVNAALNGLTTQGLARMLTCNRHLRLLIPRSRLITITTGSNDLLTWGKAYFVGYPISPDLLISQMAINYNIIAAQLRSLQPTALVQIATLYNPLPPSSVAATAQVLIQQANTALAQTAAQYNFELIPLNKAINRNTLGPDSLHPSAFGQQQIAREFARGLYRA